MHEDHVKISIKAHNYTVCLTKSLQLDSAPCAHVPAQDVGRTSNAALAEHCDGSSVSWQHRNVHLKSRG
jgi:hypothetical protein